MKFNFLNGETGEQSSKRLFTIILMALWVIYFFANLFWGKTLKDTIEDNLFYLILFFYAGITLEGWKEVFLPKDKAGGSKTTQTSETKTEVKKEEIKQ